MYLGFYKLKELPFRLAPDSRFMFWSAGHTAALACVQGIQKSRGGCAILIGERGTGKTGLLEYFRRHSSAPTALRIDFPPRTMTELTEWLHEGDESEGANAGRVILCDNAHLFHETMLAALLQGESPPGVPASRVVLAGEPALAQALEAPQLATLGKLRCERFHLPPLTAAEVTAYIAHRLNIAGASGARIFRDDVCSEVHRETRGNPRLINALCDAAMTVACERELHEVGSGEVRRALEDIGRLVALQAEEPELAVPRAPHDDQAPGRTVYARLRLMSGEALVLERELTHGKLSIGRSADSDLCVNSLFVSRQHCRIVTSEHRCILEDVHSTNGLYVNEQRVRRHHLRDGDVVQIGEHRLHYVDLRQGAGNA